MLQEKAVRLYRDYMISIKRDDGVWWATAGPARSSLGGDRPVVGGPWTSEADAVRAAEAFCNSGRAG
jgi:hypothetical protein